ncbi:hypothetical protein [Candidatus Regiella insecticola]
MDTVILPQRRHCIMMEECCGLDLTLFVNVAVNGSQPKQRVTQSINYELKTKQDTRTGNHS